MKIPITERVRTSSTVGPGQEGYFEDYYEDRTRMVNFGPPRTDQTRGTVPLFEKSRATSKVVGKVVYE